MKPTIPQPVGFRAGGPPEWVCWVLMVVNVVAIFSLMWICPRAYADLDVGVTHSTYDADRLPSDTGIQVRAGKSLYVWGSYENPDIKLVGQSMGTVEMWGGGVGSRFQHGRFSAFGEFGYFAPDVSTVAHIRDEAVEQALANDHGSEKGLGQRMPFHPEHTVYDLEPGFGGRVGVGWELRKRLKATLAYRFVRLNEELDACEGSDPTCDYPVTDGRHWQNRQTLDLSSVEVGLFLVF